MHHLNLSVFFVNHIYQQILTLGKQMFPGNNKALVDAYEDATLCKYGYLVISSTANGDDT